MGHCINCGSCDVFFYDDCGEPTTECNECGHYEEFYGGAKLPWKKIDKWKITSDYHSETTCWTDSPGGD